jgi:hypothetical protein
MGVGRDGQSDAVTERGLDGEVIEVEAIRLGIHLEHDAPCRRFPEHRLEVEIHAGPAAEQPPSRMAEDVDGRMPEGAKDPLGLFAAGKSEGRVQRDHHDVEGLKGVVIQVESAVGEDVHLRSGQDGETLELGIQAVNGPPLATKPDRVESPGYPQMRRMVRDGEILVAELLCRSRHPLEGIPSVTRSRVHLQVSTDLPRFYQARKGSLEGGLDLAPVLAELRRDEREPDRLGHLPLRSPADPPCPAPDAVLVHLESARLGQFADGNVV